MVQAAALAAVLVSVALVDRLGRRPVLLSGIGAMIAADVVLIVVFAAHSPAIFGFIGVLMFTMGFTFGFGALVWVYAGENFPSRLRSMGSSAMQTANLLANAIVAGVFLTMLHSLGGAGTFGVFGVSQWVDSPSCTGMLPRPKVGNSKKSATFGERRPLA